MALGRLSLCAVLWPSCANLGLVGSHVLCLPTGGQTLGQA